MRNLLSYVFVHMSGIKCNMTCSVSPLIIQEATKLPWEPGSYLSIALWCITCLWDSQVDLSISDINSYIDGYVFTTTGLAHWLAFAILGWVLWHIFMFIGGTCHHVCPTMGWTSQCWCIAIGLCVKYVGFYVDLEFLVRPLVSVEPRNT